MGAVGSKLRGAFTAKARPLYKRIQRGVLDMGVKARRVFASRAKSAKSAKSVAKSAKPRTPLLERLHRRFFTRKQNTTAEKLNKNRKRFLSLHRITHYPRGLNHLRRAYYGAKGLINKKTLKNRMNNLYYRNSNLAKVNAAKIEQPAFGTVQRPIGPSLASSFEFVEEPMLRTAIKAARTARSVKNKQA